MKHADILGIATQVLSQKLGAFGFQQAEAEERLDHDDEAAIFVTARYRRGSSVPGGRHLVEALGALQAALAARGETRFAYLEHRFSEDDEFRKADPDAA